MLLPFPEEYFGAKEDINRYWGSMEFSTPSELCLRTVKEGKIVSFPTIRYKFANDLLKNIPLILTLEALE
jgi:hypothetical protein